MKRVYWTKELRAGNPVLLIYEKGNVENVHSGFSTAQ
jgi:hypothetical protein